MNSIEQWLGFSSHNGSGRNYRYQIQRHQAPALFDAVREVAEKSGVKHPEIYFIDERFIERRPTLFHLGYNMYASGTPEKPAVTIGKDLIKHLTGDAHGHKITPEVKAIIAHEFCHLKHDIAPGSITQNARHFPLVGIFSGIAALATYHYFQTHPEHKPKLRSALSDEEPQEMQEIKRDMHPALYAGLVNAQYLAASALGLAGGMTGRRFAHHFAEYRADRYAAELFQDSKPMANAIRQVNNVPKEFIQKIRGMVRKGLDEGKITQQQLQTEEMIKRVNNWITHPKASDRLSRLESMSFPAR